MSFDRLAKGDFSRAVRKSFWRKVSSWISGESNDLLPFDKVREKLPLKGQYYLGLQVVPIDKIVGSMGRYRDFDRAFLPRQTRTKNRWISIDLTHYTQIPLPPVDLYKIGDVYFVRDGNHRISVARERGQEMVDAYVTEIKVPVSLTPDIDLEDLERKKEYAHFLEQTELKKLVPDVDIEFTLPGEYDRLLEHINTHRWYLGEQQEREVLFDEAVKSWYETVYCPLVEIIREQGIQKEFPERTEADLYLWVVEYEWYRREAYKEHYSIAEAAEAYTKTYSNWPVKRLVSLLRDASWIDNHILTLEKNAFYQRSQISELIPGVDITLTLPSQYEKLLDHISVHRWYLGESQGHEVPFQLAVVSWYNHVYLPLCQMITEQNILDEFPGRTEADLYLWILEHRDALSDALGWEIEADTAAADLFGRPLESPQIPSPRIIDETIHEQPDPVKVPMDVVTENALQRSTQIPTTQERGRFVDLLVAVSGDESDWAALDQAILVAQKEDGKLRGLHVVQKVEQIESQETQDLIEEFNRRCQAAGVFGEMAVDVGNITQNLCERARWNDLVVLNLKHPPASQPLVKIWSGFRTLIRHCGKPLLAVRGMTTSMERILLAYDGSLKSDEALLISAYFINRRGAHLDVVTVIERNRTTAETIQRAQKYLLAHNISAQFWVETGPAGETILKKSETLGSDLILIGGYGQSPVVEIVLGSTVDQVLRESALPVLISR